MQKKKLLIAVDTYFPKKDGVTIFLKKIIPRLKESFDITIVAPAFAEYVKPIKGTALITLPTSKIIKVADYNSIKWSISNAIKIKKQVKEADIIWTQDLALTGLLAILFSKLNKKPVLTFVHQIPWEHLSGVLPRFLKTPLYFFTTALARFLYNKCNLILIPYRGLADLLNEKGVKAKKAVVELGINFNEFYPAPDKAAAKAQLGINPKSIVIGYCGRISKEKDLATLRRAYSRLKEEHKNTYLLIIGSGPKTEVEKFKTLKDVKITGFVKNVVPYLQAMDIFVMPSLTETTSLATIEAMACSTAVLSTKVGYIKEYLIDRFNGMFFKKQNDYILRRKIELLMRDKELRHRLGVNARESVMQRFSWEKTVDKFKRALDMF